MNEQVKWKHSTCVQLDVGHICHSCKFYHVTHPKNCLGVQLQLSLTSVSFNLTLAIQFEMHIIDYSYAIYNGNGI